MKGRTTTIIVVSATVGLTVGVLSTAWVMSRFLTHAQTTSAVATLAVEGLALQNIHDGDSDAATRLLQTRLDAELMTINWEVKKGYALTPQARKAISRIKRLRESSGYEPSDPEVRRYVREALATTASTDTDVSTLYNPASLVEVRRFTDLPEGVKVLANNRYMKAMIDNTPTEFLVGGASDSSAIVAYEQFGFVPNYRAQAYVYSESRWVAAKQWDIGSGITNLHDLISLTSSSP